MSEENKDLFLENGNESQAEEAAQAVTEPVEAAEVPAEEAAQAVTEPVEPAQEAEPEDPDDAAIEELRKFGADVIEKVKSKKKPLIIASAVVVLLFVVLNAAKIGNAAVKLFTSPAGYFRHVEGKVVKDAAKEAATAYDTAVSEILSVNDVSSEGRVGIELGKEILDFLEDETEMDFEWMKEFSVGYGTDSSKKGSQVEVDFSLDGKKIISLLVLMNLEDEKGFLQIPELNESYIGMDIEEFFEFCDMDVDLDDINEMYEMYEKVYDALPNKSKVEKIIERYASLMLSCVDDVEQSKEEVSVEDYSKKMTVLEATIDEKTVRDALEAVIKELKKDKDVKKIVYEVLELQDEVDADDVYDAFLEVLDDLEDDLDDIEDEEFEIVWKTYVDSKGAIQGRSFEVEDEDIEVTSLMVKKGSKFAYECSVDFDDFKGGLTGTGKAKGLTVSGDFVLDVMGIDILDATLDDVKLADLCRGDFSGTISISLSKKVAKMLDAAADLPIDVKDIVLKIDMDASTSKSDVKVSVLEEKELIAAISVESKRGKADNVKSPKDSDVVMVEDESDLEEWVDEIDLEAFVESLEGKIGEDLYEMLEDAMSNGFSLSDMFEEEEVDYYDDYYDGYYEDDWYEDDWYDGWYDDDWY